MWRCDLCIVQMHAFTRNQLRYRDNFEIAITILFKIACIKLGLGFFAESTVPNLRLLPLAVVHYRGVCRASET
jgi:hypothetical protein